MVVKMHVFLEQYCNRWKLQVNLDTTEVIIFSSRKKLFNADIKYNNTSVEQVYYHQQIGVNLSFTGYLKQALLD